MQREVSTFCPLIKKGCLQWDCTFFTKLVGKDPQTGNPIDDWDCAIKWLPILLVENSQQGRSVAAAVESFRNKMVEANEAVLKLEHQG